MWLARPVYEFLPYLYMLVGVALLAAAWFIDLSTLPSVFMLIGVLSIMAGLVLWLRRRDYRTRQSEYNSRSLED
jgi:Flp pilus assembly protein TadB